MTLLERLQLLAQVAPVIGLAFLTVRLYVVYLDKRFFALFRRKPPIAWFLGCTVLLVSIGSFFVYAFTDLSHVPQSVQILISILFGIPLGGFFIGMKQFCDCATDGEYAERP